MAGLGHEDRNGHQQKVGKDKDTTLNWLCEQEGELAVTVTDLWGPGVDTAPRGSPWGGQGAFLSEVCSVVRRSEFESWVLFCSHRGWAEVGEHLEDDPLHRRSWAVSKHCRNIQGRLKLLHLLPQPEVVYGEYIQGNTLTRCHMDTIMNLKFSFKSQFHMWTKFGSLVSQRVEKNANLELTRW